MRRIMLSLFAVCFMASLAFADPLPPPPAKVYIVELASVMADVDGTAAALAAQYEGELGFVWKHALRGFTVRLTPENALRLSKDARVKGIEVDAPMELSGPKPEKMCPPLSLTCLPQGPVWPTNTTSCGERVRPVPEGAYPEVYGTNTLWHLARISHRLRPVLLEDFNYPLYGKSEANHAKEAIDNADAADEEVRIYVLDHGIVRHHQEFWSDDYVNTRSCTQWAPGSSPRVELGATALTATEEGSPPSAHCMTYTSWATTQIVNGIHGTQVASIAAGRNVGVARSAHIRLVPIQVNNCGGNSSAAAIINGFEQILVLHNNNSAKGAVVNASTWRWNPRHRPPAGKDPPCPESCPAVQPFLNTRQRDECLFDCPTAPMNEYTRLETAITNVLNAGIPIVASANNQGIDACHTLPPALSLREAKRKDSRAQVGVFSVGGIAKTADVRYPGTGSDGVSSNFGNCVDIWAPMERVISGTPNGGFDQYTSGAVSGTSFSAPIVSGIIARLMVEEPALYANPALTVARVWERLEETATRLLPADADTRQTEPSYLAYIGNVTITEPPRSRQTVRGNTITLTVETLPPSGALPLRYEWYRGASGDTSHPVGTNKDFHVQVQSTERYWVRVIDPNKDNGGNRAYADSIDAEVVAVEGSPRRRPSRVGPALLPTTTYSISLGQSIAIAPPEENANFTYEWHRSDTPEAPAAPVSYATRITESPTTSTTYWVKTTDRSFYPQEITTSELLNVVVNQPNQLTISVSPSTEVDFNTTVSLTVSFAGGQYEWREGPYYDLSKPVLGTQQTLSFSATADKSYWVRVTAPGGIMDSPVVSITVRCSPPTVSILSQRIHHIIEAGEVLMATAWGVGKEVVYFWYEGALDTGVLSNHHTIGVMPPVNTTYWVRAVDSCGQTATASFTVRVCKPKLTQDLAATSYASTTVPATLTVRATPAQANAPLTYRWYRNGNTNPIYVETHSSGVSTRQVPYTDAGTYYVTITGECGGSLSAEVRTVYATVVACSPVVIDNQPAGYSQYRGYGGSTTVYASSTNLTYQWYQGESGNTAVPVNGQTTRTLTINNMQNTARYWARITGQCGVKDSNAAFMSVYPQITMHPQTIDVPYGESATLGVQTSGTYLSFQWYQGESGDTSRPVGSNSATYVTPPVFEPLPYWCRVTSGNASVNTYGAMVNPY